MAMFFRFLATVLLKIAGLLCLLVGFATIWTPIPVGLPLILLGLSILLLSSPFAVRILAWLRSKWGFLDRWLAKLEPHMPKRLRRILRVTRAAPDHERV